MVEQWQKRGLIGSVCRNWRPEGTGGGGGNWRQRSALQDVKLSCGVMCSPPALSRYIAITEGKTGTCANMHGVSRLLGPGLPGAAASAAAAGERRHRLQCAIVSGAKQSAAGGADVEAAAGRHVVALCKRRRAWDHAFSQTFARPKGTGRLRVTLHGGWPLLPHFHSTSLPKASPVPFPCSPWQQRAYVLKLLPVNTTDGVPVQMWAGLGAEQVVAARHGTVAFSCWWSSSGFQSIAVPGAPLAAGGSRGKAMLRQKQCTNQLCSGLSHHAHRSVGHQETNPA